MSTKQEKKQIEDGSTSEGTKDTATEEVLDEASSKCKSDRGSHNFESKKHHQTLVTLLTSDCVILYAMIFVNYRVFAC